MNNEIMKIAELYEGKFFQGNGYKPKQVEVLAIKKCGIWDWANYHGKGSPRRYGYLVLARQLHEDGSYEYMTHDCKYSPSADDISTGDGEYYVHTKSYEEAMELFEYRFKKCLNKDLMNMSEKDIQEEEKRYA